MKEAIVMVVGWLIGFFCGSYFVFFIDEIIREYKEDENGKTKK